MDLNDIKAKAGIQIIFDDNCMGVSFLGDNDIVIMSYQTSNLKRHIDKHENVFNIRNVKWNLNTSLEQLLTWEFINIESINKIIDWTLPKDNVIYKRLDITLTKEEIKKRLGMKHLIIK